MSLLTSALTVGFIILAIMFGISFAPDAGPLPAAMTDAINTMIGYATSWGYVFDFHTAFIIIGLYFSVELSIVLLKASIWIVKTSFRVGGPN